MKEIFVLLVDREPKGWTGDESWARAWTGQLQGRYALRLSEIVPAEDSTSKEPSKRRYWSDAVNDWVVGPVMRGTAE